ncbi:GNAT family N-acetyltransferase [Micromonospora sp. NBC_01813]|uniref:GNAT family N-acetyltransferase n=1 Tax=Micromonospora sp. NBC_01813 TaxID=2975988 RepID=UPI002DDAC3BD|nr:GNAT family N-acetyltransferase [Micromonospora sp. NBC_01813]WSA11734.1 GNAT family N-acetyltransferase [Micromonospora sp. NBC_01813]
MLRDVERAAGLAFDNVGMPEIANDEPLPLDVLADYQAAGRAWVAADRPAGSARSADAPVGYLLADVVDGNLHIEQVSVHPGSAGQGIGRRLIEHLAGVASARGVPALTLTTFAEVPWNAPYYERCGFRALADEALPLGLRAVRAREADHGLDRWPRVAMHRDL